MRNPAGFNFSALSRCFVFPLVAIAFYALCFSPGRAEANVSTGERLIEEKCAECHAFTKPETSSRERLTSRKGQDLFYAGSKYNRPWLEKWLQAPVKIRPAGKYGSFVSNGGGGSHIALSADEAANATGYMMTLKAPQDVVEPGIYRAGEYGAGDGRFAYTVTNNCAGCHMWTPEKGGRSAPELYTGGERMTADYIASFIKNPQNFDANNWMPRQFFSDRNIQRLTAFILGLSAKEKR